MPGAGAIYHHATGTFGSALEDGDAAGLVAAKAALAAGGLLQMGPGTEGIPLLTGWGIIQLSRVDALGRLFISRVNMTDGDDPTKVLAWDLSAITAATIRTAVAPNYGGFLLLPSSLGSSGQFLRSNGAGVQPSWAAPSVTNALLDGANHTDTAAQGVTRGSLIYGNSTPAWDELVIGAANTVLTSNGTDVAWSANPAVAHDTLAHLAPIVAANCTLNNGSDSISSANLANVRVGDFVYFGSFTNATIQGARVAGLGGGTVSIDKTYVGANISNQTFIFTPGDHWNDTAALEAGTGAGLLMSLGRGTYDSVTNTSGTFQEVRGPWRWRPHANGALVCPAIWQASASTTTLSGFALEEAVGGSLLYFYLGNLNADRVWTAPNSSGTVLLDTSTATVTNKTLDTANKIQVDGSSTRTVFADSSGNSRIAPDVSVVTAERVVSWPNYAGRYHVEGAVVTFGNGDTTPTVAGSRLFKTNNGGATTITALDDAVAGQEVTIIATDANTTLQHAGGGSLRLQGSINYTMGVDDTIRLVNDGTNWYENGRTVI